MSKSKNTNSNKKSGSAGFLITLLFLSWITGFSFPGILAGIFVGLGIGKITSIMGSGLDTTTHNKQDEERRPRQCRLRGACVFLPVWREAKTALEAVYYSKTLQDLLDAESALYPSDYVI